MMFVFQSNILPHTLMTVQRHHFAIAVLSLLIFSIPFSKPCQVLQSRVPFPLLSVGITNSHVTLITREMTVFEVSLDRLNLQTHQLNLTDTFPVEMFEKWPALSRSVVAESLTQGRNIFTTTFDSDEYLNIIDFQNSTNSTTSFGFDLSTGNRIGLLCYDMMEAVFVPTASSPSTFPEDKLLVMTRFANREKVLVRLTRVAIIEYNQSLSLTADYTAASSFAFCLTDEYGGTSGSSFPNRTDHCKPLSTFVRAFMFNNTMYLFGKDGFVYVAILGKDKTIEKTLSIPFEQFFICSEGSDYPSSRLTIIINTILKVAIIIALLLSFILMIIVILTSCDRQSSIAPPKPKLNIKTKVKRVKKHRSSDDIPQSRGKLDHVHQKSNSSSLSFPKKKTGRSKVKKTTTMPKSKSKRNKRQRTNIVKSKKQTKGKSIRSSSQSKSGKSSGKDSSKSKKTENRRETSMMKTVNVKKKRELKGSQNTSRSRSRSGKGTKSNSNSEKR